MNNDGHVNDVNAYKYIKLRCFEAVYLQGNNELWRLNMKTGETGNRKTTAASIVNFTAAKFKHQVQTGAAAVDKAPSSDSRLAGP